MKAIVYLIMFLILTISLVLGVALDVITTKMRQEHERYDVTAETLFRSENLARAVGRSNRLNNLWAFTKNKELLTQRDQARAEALESFGLIERVDPDPADSRLLSRAKQAVQDLYAAQDQFASGPTAKPSKSSLAYLGGLSDRAMSAIQPFVDAKTAKLSLSRAENSRFENLADWMARMSEGVSILLFIAVIWLLHSTLLKPLRHLFLSIIDFRKGNKESRVQVGKMTFAEAKDAADGFNKLADEVCDIERRKMEYLVGISHDIRNPVTAIKSVVGLLLKGTDGASQYRAHELLKLVDLQADRIEQLVVDWMDVQRISRGEITLRMVSTDIRHIVEECSRIWQVSSAGHSIEALVPNHPVMVYCDPNRMIQVLNNLISNAIKYSPDGGRVEIVLESDEDNAALSVIDHGVGISEQDLERLFEPFQRAIAVRDFIPGVGLGLSISRKIVEAHGGKISVDSKLGLGTIFLVKIPTEEKLRKAA